jgi:hypothetical protein
MSVEDIVYGLAIIQQKRGRIVDQGDVEMLALAIKELRKGRPGSTSVPEGATNKEPEPHSFALLKLEGAAKPLYFVMEERYGKPDEEDYQGNRQYFYEEHSCPTNWLPTCVAVIEDGDTDPHGFLTFVRSVPIPPGYKEDPNDERWRDLFPEAFPSS